MTHCIELGITFHTITCARDDCGLVFAVPSFWQQRKRETHTDFYCPNGHVQRYLTKSDAEKLRDELAAQKAETERVRASRDEEARIRRGVERRLTATRGVVTRTKRRVGHGVCPCCNRSFSALARHMATKHPEYADAGPEAAR